MKRIIALMCVSACLTAMAGVSANLMTGSRICFLHPYEKVNVASGFYQAQPCDPFNIGGWTVTLVNEGQSGYLTIDGGLIDDVAMPIKVDYNAATVTLEANNEPFATTSGTKTTTSGIYTITVDSTLNYYIVNEAWVLDNERDLEDIHGTILDDGSIEIADGFAYYYKNVKTTTITYKGSVTKEFTDTMRWTSMIYRNTQLIKPNGKHEFTNVQTGATDVVDVYMHQEGDNVYVMNLYGYGWGENYMVLHKDGTADYPGQPLRDVDDTLNPAGDGVWYNTNGSTMGNQASVTTQRIVWGLTVPNDNATNVAPGWNNNKLYYTDGSTFVVPSDGIRGDVNNDGSVTIADVTALIDLLLGGDMSGANMFNCDCNRDGNITIADVTALIDYLLGSSWPN